MSPVSLHLRSEALALLRGPIIFGGGQKNVLGQGHDQLIGSRHVGGLFAQDNFVATAEDFNFFGLEPKLLGQTDGLAVAGAKYASCTHRWPSPSVYTLSIYIQGSWLGPARW